LSSLARRVQEIKPHFKDAQVNSFAEQLFKDKPFALCRKVARVFGMNLFGYLIIKAGQNWPKAPNFR